MKIAYNPSSSPALPAAPAGNDVIFDLPGSSIYARGVLFKGTDTTYIGFKKHTSAEGGGYSGLVQAPSYTPTTVRYLKEDGSWENPIPSIISSTYTILGSGDLNTLLQEGRWYYIPGNPATTTNGPAGINNGAELYVGRHGSGYRYQKVITVAGPIYFRQYNSTTWAPWVRWYTDANTDTKVTQSLTAVATFKPLILGANNGSATITGETHFASLIYAQPNIGAIFANLFNGQLNGTISAATTATTLIATDISTKVATTAFVRTAVANLVNGAPEALDTLKELADYLQSGSVAGGLVEQLGKKVNKAGDIMTGALTATSFIGPLKGNADTATSLGTVNIGSTSLPVYFVAGRPVVANNLFTSLVNDGNNISMTINDMHRLLTVAYSATSGVTNLVHCFDNRSENPLPTNNFKGIKLWFKYNTTDGLVDGGTYHGVMYFKPYTDSSGGEQYQLGFTDNGNLHIRSSVASATWNTWKKFLHTGNSSLVSTANDVTIKIHDITATIPSSSYISGNYVTLNTNQTITGLKDFTTSIHYDTAKFGTGGWARGLHAINSGSIKAGIGFLGTGTTLNCAFIGVGESPHITKSIRINNTLALTDLPFEAASFKKTGGTGNLILRADGGILNMLWSAVAGSPTYVWGTTASSSDTRVYNTNELRVAHAETLTGFTTTNINSPRDANNCTSNGIWYVNSNYPTSMMTTYDGALYSQAYSGVWVAQIAQDYRNGDMAVRGMNNGTWTAWNKVLTTRNWTSITDGRYLPLTGGAITGDVTMTGSITINGWFKNTLANYGLYNIAGDARWSWNTAKTSWYADKSITSYRQLISEVATGTAPFKVNSSSLVNNLNADLLDGYHEHVFVRDRHLGYKTDYDSYVILLFPDNELGFSRITGQIFTTSKGAGRYYSSNINIWKSRWDAATGIDLMFGLDNTGGTYLLYKLVTCLYGGKTWWALLMTSVSSHDIFFKGTSLGIAWTVIPYHKSNPVTILNAEINGSIVDKTSAIARLKLDAINYALLTDNVASATKLLTSRKIFGQPFDGTADVAGALTATSGSFSANVSISTTLAVELSATFASSRIFINNLGQIAPTITTERLAGMYGIYDATKIGHVWSMGVYYSIAKDGSNFGNLYGMAYKHTNNTTGGTMATGHQIVFMEAGVPGVSIGMNGNIWNKGSLTTLGAANISGAITSSSIITGTRFSSSIAQGGVPLTVTSTTLCPNLNADMLDGVHYLNILERIRSGLSSSGTAVGWFRIAQMIRNNAGGNVTMLHITRNYTYANNEAYSFSISETYDGNVSITQLSGYANTRLITKIRVCATNSALTYIDLFIGASTTDNTYQWTTVGSATSYTAWEVGAVASGTVTEFTTVNGCKSDKGFTGDLVGNITGSIIGNSSTADALKTSRLLWGQSFNGTANVSGPLTGVTLINSTTSLALNSPSQIMLTMANDDTKSVVLNTTSFKPYDAANGLINLGTVAARWKVICGIAADFSGNVNSSGIITGSRLFSNVAQGTAPLSVLSTTMIPNLNALLHGGLTILEVVPYNVYSYTNGCLVKLGAPTGANLMYTIRIVGNSYHYNIPPIDTTIQFYDYTPTSIINCTCIHNGHNIGTINVFVYDGATHIWFKQSSAYQSFLITARIGNMSGANQVVSVKNIGMPTEGVTNLGVISPFVSALTTDIPVIADLRYLKLTGGALTGAVTSTHDITAKSFIKSSGTSIQLLRADGGIATFNWSGQEGQPAWLWGGNTQQDYVVYNPSNFRVANANTLGDLLPAAFARADARGSAILDLDTVNGFGILQNTADAWATTANHYPSPLAGTMFYGNSVLRSNLIYGTYASNKWFVRGGGGSGGRTPWLELLSSGNFNTFAPTLAGVGATGTWGINIAGNAATVTNGMYLNAVQTSTASKTFSTESAAGEYSTRAIHIREVGMTAGSAATISNNNYAPAIGFHWSNVALGILTLRNNSQFYFVSSSSGGTSLMPVNASAFVKMGSSDLHVLLGAGGHKLISDFATSGHTHPYLPLTGGTLTGTLHILPSNDNYAQGIRIANAASNYSIINFGVTLGSTSGVIPTQWVIGKTDTNTFVITQGGIDKSLGLELTGSFANGAKWLGETMWHSGNDHLFSLRSTNTLSTARNGYFKINIPDTVSWMSVFTLRCYNSYSYYDIVISGYEYRSSYWWLPKARLIGGDSDIKVDFGYDAVGLLWVAIPANGYCNIEVLNALCGHQFHKDFGSLFTITHVATLGGTILTSLIVYPPLTTSAAIEGYLPLTGGTITGNLKVNGSLTGTLIGNASSATKLATSRLIFGRSFDGTANVTGNVECAQVIATSHIITSASIYANGGIYNTNHGNVFQIYANTTSVFIENTNAIPFRFNRQIYVDSPILATSIIKQGGTANLVLLANGGVLDMAWSALSGSPYYVWGTSSSNNITRVYNLASMLIGTSSTLAILDNRGADRAPNYYADFKVSAFFNYDVPLSISGWKSGITVRGWNAGYSTWQIISNSDPGNKNDSLYFRTSSSDTAWNPIRKILDSINFRTVTDNIYLLLTGGIMIGSIVPSFEFGTPSLGELYSPWEEIFANNAYFTDCSTGFLSATNAVIYSSNENSVLVNGGFKSNGNGGYGLTVIGSESTTTRIKGQLGSVANTAISRYEVQWYSLFARFDVHRGGGSEISKFSWKFGEVELMSLNMGGNLYVNGNITVKTGLRIGAVGALYLGEESNSSYVFVSDICSLDGAANWNINILGEARFDMVLTRDFSTDTFYAETLLANSVTTLSLEVKQLTRLIGVTTCSSDLNVGNSIYLTGGNRSIESRNSNVANVIKFLPSSKAVSIINAAIPANIGMELSSDFGLEIISGKLLKFRTYIANGYLHTDGFLSTTKGLHMNLTSIYSCKSISDNYSWSISSDEAVLPRIRSNVHNLLHTLQTSYNGGGLSLPGGGGFCVSNISLDAATPVNHKWNTAISGSCSTGTLAGVGVHGIGGYIGVAGFADSGAGGGISYGIYGAAGNSSSIAGYFLGYSSASCGVFVAGYLLTSGGVRDSSDMRLKKNIEKLSIQESLLDRCDKISLVSFDWKEDNRNGFGVIAQEVLVLFPELVSDHNDSLSVNYTAITILKVASLERKIEKLTERILQLEKLQCNYTTID